MTESDKEQLEELFYLIKQNVSLDRSYYRECRIQKESGGSYESRWSVRDEVYLHNIKKRIGELQKITGVSFSDISMIYNMIYN